MERVQHGGGRWEMSGERSGEEDNLVQSVLDDWRKNTRERVSTQRGGHDGQETKTDSITPEKESVVLFIRS